MNDAVITKISGPLVVASGMKNDGQLATQLVVWTSLMSIITLFVAICILLSCGLIIV